MPTALLLSYLGQFLQSGTAFLLVFVACYVLALTLLYLSQIVKGSIEGAA